MTDITEADFQAQVMELAHTLSWEVMHVRKSIGRRGGNRAWQTATNIPGWPDLFFFSPRWRAHFAAELKSESGRLTDEQVTLHEYLRNSGVDVYVWRPSDFDEIVEVLSRPRRRGHEAAGLPPEVLPG